jgi:hypothetical protein
VVYNCYWSSPAKSFSGPSPAGLVTRFYCLKFETPPEPRTYIPQKQGGPVIRHSKHIKHRVQPELDCPSCFLFSYLSQKRRQHPVFILTVLFCASSFRGNVFTEPLLRNDRFFIRLLRNNGCTRYLFRGLCLAMGLYATIYFSACLFSVCYNYRPSEGQPVPSMSIDSCKHVECNITLRVSRKCILIFQYRVLKMTGCKEKRD